MSGINDKTPLQTSITDFNFVSQAQLARPKVKEKHQIEFAFIVAAK